MIEFEALVKIIHKSINDALKSAEADGIRHLQKFFYPVDEQGNEIEDDGDEKEGVPKLVDFESGGRYHPKTVVMDFPVRTSNGVEIKQVDVPLIVLSPISTPKVSSAKFTADLEVTSEDGRLKVGFPDKRKRFFGGKESREGNTHIEVTVEADESPEGLQKIIEGYERALRAQIPG